jgi:hypothetical protein
MEAVCCSGGLYARLETLIILQTSQFRTMFVVSGKDFMERSWMERFETSQ